METYLTLYQFVYQKVLLVSVLLGSLETTKQGQRFRKVMGGGWRQALYLAAAHFYALDNNIPRLKEKIISEQNQ